MISLRLKRRMAHHTHTICISIFYLSIGITVFNIFVFKETHHANIGALVSDALARFAHSIATGD